MAQAYKIVIEHDSREGYVATFPELMGYQAQAESLKVLMERIREVVALCPEAGEPPSGRRPGMPKEGPKG